MMTPVSTSTSTDLKRRIKQRIARKITQRAYSMDAVPPTPLADQQQHAANGNGDCEERPSYSGGRWRTRPSDREGRATTREDDHDEYDEPALVIDDDCEGKMATPYQ
jgi:hypothetical protein